MLPLLKTKEKLLSAEVCLKEGSDAVFRSITFTKQGKQLSYAAESGNEYSQTAFLETLKKNQAVIVSVSGKGVMTRQTASDDLENNDALFNSVLPNSRKEEFYYSVLRGQRMYWISLVRRSAVEPILEMLRSKGVFILGIYCGPQLCGDIIKYLPSEKKEITTAGYHLSICDNEPEEIHPIDDADGITELSGEQVNNRLVLAIAGGFHHYAGVFANTQSEISEEVSKSISEYNYYIRIKKYLLNFGLALFLVLLVNFFLLDRYSAESGRLSTLVSAFSSQTTQSDSLQAEFIRKKEFLEGAGLTGTSRISMMADQLASELPASITLESLDIFPVTMNEGDDTDFKNEKDIARISGETPDAVALNEWIRCISAYPFVKKVSISNYSKIAEHSSSHFELEIGLSEK
jgi:hypothetical protein